MIESNDKITVRFLEAQLTGPEIPAGYVTFNGRPCTINEAIKVLRQAGRFEPKQNTFFENGVVMDDGHEYFFSGYLDGKAFKLSILGNRVGLKINKLFTDQFPDRGESHDPSEDL